MSYWRATPCGMQQQQRSVLEAAEAKVGPCLGADNTHLQAPQQCVNVWHAFGQSS
jgi:hypothetical protein